MARRSLAKLFRLSLIGLVVGSLSACWSQFLTGNVTEAPSVKPDLMAETASLSAGATAAQCASSGGDFDCVYIIDGETVESLAHLISLYGGLLGAMHDPLILEVPAGVISATGTFDAGSGLQPLPISRADSFAVQPGMRITAEVGTTFLFFELPVSVTSGLPISNPTTSPVFSYTLAFVQDVPLGPPPALTVKPMMAGSVTLFWQTYYVPLLPCAADFQAVPAITIPLASTPQNLETTLGDLIRNHSAAPCNHYSYNFTNAMPPAGLLFLPFLSH